MASIIRRGNGQYQAQIRRKGYPTQTKTFRYKKEATAWAAAIETAMNRDEFEERSESRNILLSELLQRYLNEITPKKRGALGEGYRIRQFLRHPLAQRPLSSLRAADFAEFRDERLRTCGSATVNRELCIFSSVFVAAKKDWSIPINNPVASIRKPPLSRPRECRLSPEEEIRLLAAAKASKSAMLPTIIILAIETGMRAGEIIGLRWENIDLEQHIIHLEQTKNGDRRTVPLSETAEQAILGVPRPSHGGRFSTINSTDSLGKNFRRACRRAGIEGLRFHDLRHEAASRLVPRMTTATLAKIMGWRSINMAMRYYNPTAHDLVKAVRALA